MNLVRKIFRYGAKRTLYIAFDRLESRWFDLHHGTDTFSRVPVKAMKVALESKAHAFKYDPSSVTALRTVLRRLPLAPDDTFVDFGSGKGLALLVAARFPFKEVIGVEFAADLCAIARENLKRYRRRHPDAARVSIHELDVLTFPIEASHTVFYMFNPFDEVVMQAILRRIAESHAKSPRRILLVYYHPICRETIDSAGLFTLRSDCEVLGRRFRIYETPGGDDEKKSGGQAMG